MLKCTETLELKVEGNRFCKHVIILGKINLLVVYFDVWKWVGVSALARLIISLAAHWGVCALRSPFNLCVCVCVSNSASPVNASLQPTAHYVPRRGGGEGRGGAQRASSTHAPLADPLPRRSSGNLRNEVGASSAGWPRSDRAELLSSLLLMFTPPVTALQPIGAEEDRETGRERRRLNLCARVFVCECARGGLPFASFLWLRGSVFRWYSRAITWANMVLL